MYDEFFNLIKTSEVVLVSCLSVHCFALAGPGLSPCPIWSGLSQLNLLYVALVPILLWSWSQPRGPKATTPLKVP